MISSRPELSWLEDPGVYEVNRRKAHSDHVFPFFKEAKAEGINVLNLDGTWKFVWDEKPPEYGLRGLSDETGERFFQAAFWEKDWKEIQVPGHVQLQGYDSCHYVNTMYPWDGHSELRPPSVPWEDNPAGSYIREFTIGDDEAFLKDRVFVSFQGVETAFYVWCNQRFVGYGEDGFTPSEYELTGMLHRGVNRLEVRVYKRSSASWIEDQDFFRFTGIFRSVFVYCVPPVHLEDIFVKADLTEDGRDGRLEAELTVESQNGGCYEADLELEDNGQYLPVQKKDRGSGM